MLGSAFLAVLAGLAGVAHGLGSTDSITWGGDNSRSSYETNHNMDPAVVGSSQFDQLFKTPLPGNYIGASETVFSQPLVFTPSGGDQQFVYLATTQNNVYKFDAKTGEIVAQRNLHIPFLTADLDGCVDINPTVGVIGTGVIDPDTDTWFVIAKTYEDQEAGDGAQGRANGRTFIHAIDTNDLSERPNYPVPLEGITARNSPNRVWASGDLNQRPGLLHQGNFIYAGFGSHCVQYDFTGWIIGWNKETGELVERFATQGPDVKTSVKGGSIWMSGAGLSADDSGSIFYATGNGYASQLSNIPVNGFNPPTSLEEAAVHMTINEDGTLDVADFFIPWEKQALDGADKDLGTSGLNILPSEFACGDISRIGVVTGKSGKTYWLNLDNMGGYRNGAGATGDAQDDVIQVYQNPHAVYATAGVYPLEGGYIYINVIQEPTNVFKFQCTNGVPSFVKVAESPEANAYILGVSHGATTSLNGQPGTGLLWVTDVQGTQFKIYDATPVDGKLKVIKSFKINDVTKFTRPVFGDGTAYFAPRGYLVGYGAPNNPPINCTSPVAFGEADLAGETVTKDVVCTALIGTTVDGVDMAAGDSYSITEAPTMPLTLAKGEKFTVSAMFEPSDVGLLTDNVMFNTTNSVEGYSISTSARLSGTGTSAGALAAIAPKTVVFSDVVTGADPAGVKDNVILSNNGNTKLTVKNARYRLQNSGQWTLWDKVSPLKVGQFTINNIPKTVAKNGAKTLDITFDSSQSGTFVGYVRLNTNGGNVDFSLNATAGPAPEALLEFQTPDGEGWVEYEEGTPFTFGNVTENSFRSLRFRIFNAAPEGANGLTLTVSKPPFGVSGIIRAANQVDLAEGTLINPGESQSAVLTCTAPKSPWNSPPHNGTAQWTLNTNDPVSGKHLVEFFCNAVTPQSPPLLDNGLAKLQYVGCFKENNPDRQLESQILATDEMVTADCVAACAAGDWTFCGTQYHRECWAGNTIPRLRVDDGNCNFACAGDINQICGGNGVGENAGGSYMSLFADVLKWDGNYTAPPDDGEDDDDNGGGGDQPDQPAVVNPGVSGYESLGCITEATTGRALANGFAMEKATVKNCVEGCKEGGYRMAGLEYSQECWCGNELGDGAVAAPDAECNLPCKGNTTELCGAGSRLNLYSRIELPTSSVSSPASPTSESPSETTSEPSTSPSEVTTTAETLTQTPTSTKTSPEPTSTGPTAKDTVSETWKLQGCWTEATTGRALDGKLYADDDLTLEVCAEQCSDFAYFGAEYGRECWCGNVLHETSTAAQAAECKMPCGGDGTSLCGAGSRLSLYKNTANVPSGTTSAPNAKPTATDPVIREGNANFTYYGCVTEPGSGRLLDSQPLNSVNMTVDMCLEKCSDKTYVGLEYGRECWCGDKLNEFLATDEPAKNVSDSKCSMTCMGNVSEFCGAGSTMSLYSQKNKVSRVADFET